MRSIFPLLASAAALMPIAVLNALPAQANAWNYIGESSGGWQLYVDVTSVYWIEGYLHFTYSAYSSDDEQMVSEAIADCQSYQWRELDSQDFRAPFDATTIAMMDFLCEPGDDSWPVRDRIL